MLSVVGFVIVALILFAFIWAFFLLLLKNIIKVGILLFIIFIVLIGLATTDNLSKPSQAYVDKQNSVNF